MEHLNEKEVKISSATIRDLRTKRGWSQEQLAVASGIGLRTIQRVEAQGSASLETRMSLAATFDVPLADIVEESAAETKTSAMPRPKVPARYKIAAIISAPAFIVSGLGLVNALPTSNAQLNSVFLMGAIALLIFAGFGWYMTADPVISSRVRRILQATFIFAAVFCAFSFGYRGTIAYLAGPALSGLIAIIMYFVIDFLISMRHSPARH